MDTPIVIINLTSMIGLKLFIIIPICVFYHSTSLPPTFFYKISSHEVLVVVHVATFVSK